MSKFFIDRPIFAAVVSILIVLGGLASMITLPIAQFPDITPPQIEVMANYPGASAETVAQSIAAPIEQELSGAKDLLYFQSFAGNDGGYRLAVTFEIGTDIEQAAVDVQNRLKNAEPRLPQEAVRQGITITKASSAMLGVLTLKSTDPRHDALFLNGYATNNIADVIKRVPGVGSAQVFGGADYSMRLWLNPDVLSSKGLTVADVATVVREQNGLYAAGRIGATPTDHTPQITIPVITRGRYTTIEEFGNIVVRAMPDGRHLLLKDVARIELGRQSYDLMGRQDGKPTTFILAFLQSGGNALETMDGIMAAMEELKKSFPPGVYYEKPYDTTPFIDVAIEEVIKTFAEAIFLVTMVVLFFLGTWRATIIPLLAVPVAIVGTFMGMAILGFSINSLTLFGLVLAIGIVVDDAILVVENVERLMHEEHLSPRDATIKAMEQVTGPIIAIILVLSAVFLPVAFLGGLTGELYQQFAVTIAISVMISGLVALSLSPALCRLLLKPHQEKWFIFRWFDKGFGTLTAGYSFAVRQSIRFGIVTAALFGIMLWATVHFFEKVPGGFIPQEDQGYYIGAVIMPPGASLDRTLEVVKQAEDFLMSQPEIRHAVSLVGMDWLGGQTVSSSAAIMFAPLKPWNERPRPDQHVDALVGRVFGKFMSLKEGLVIAFNPPPVMGLGLKAGFEMQLQDQRGRNVRELAAAQEQLMAAARQRPELNAASLQAVFNTALPQVTAEVDNLRVKLRGVQLSDVYDTLQALLGSLYVNDFIQLGRIYRVQLQAESDFRQSPQAVRKFSVRNGEGRMVPLSDLVTTKFTSGPNFVSRFNGFNAVQITGEPAPGYSTGQAIEVMEELVRTTLPEGYAAAWSGASFQEIRASGQAPYIVAFGLLIVFLVLSAQYERWSLPLVVMLGIPSGAFGAIVAVHYFGIPKDIYFQISLLTLIGLAAKNAILITEFSAVLHEQGMPIMQAAVRAATVRLRPFIMTSMAFILGVLPLVLAEGAGAAGRRTIGTGVMGGMIAATVLDMFFVPLFFVCVAWISEKLGGRKKSLEPHDDLRHKSLIGAANTNGFGPMSASHPNLNPAATAKEPTHA